ncbi:haemagglutination activity domain protein [Synechococcus sp. PCC 7335]|uniref:two-partner secretion domain-containing protein n=1 Tax=Synechococcus sp. (strain ATCC 29403 / PCC 7335) TaxID=91464 RepID=UPI00017EC347|nr:haemagglutination activity domain protein [Synechococcus sp. PCC 7335]
MLPRQFFLSDVSQLAQYLSRYYLLPHFAFVVASVLSFGLGTTNAIAQVTEDDNMSENTTVLEIRGNTGEIETYQIQGGTQRGEVLFHSFKSFSINRNQTAEFMSSGDISTIFSRVIGEAPSNINGTISADAVDIFFINPNGITFGPTAAINIGGSVVFSTAESLIFAEDDSEFSSVNPQDAPMLTVSQPFGLFLGETSGEIILNGAELDDFNADETVLLVGNGITFVNGGGVFVESGQIELLSLAPGSRVDILPKRNYLESSLAMEDMSFSDLKLSNISLKESFVDASGEDSSTGNPGGDILLRGSQINIVDSDIWSFNSGAAGGESISIFASGDLNVDSAAEILTETFGIGEGGDVLLEARQLKIKGGSDVSTTARGNGPGGNLIINVPNGMVEVSGITVLETDIGPVNRSSRLISRTEGKQSAGEIWINTQNLLVQEGGQIDAGPSGSGDSQGIRIEATESVEVSEVINGLYGMIPSSINTASNGDSTGNAGPLRIDTNRLEITDGGQVFTTTSGAGNGGSLIVDAEEVILSGRGTSGERSGLYARTRGPGDSGQLNITTGALEVRNGARLTVSTLDPAEGDLLDDDFGRVREAVIKADSIVLDNGEITAESRSGDGGNLNLEVQDSILLQNGSLISATAGTAGLSGDGGNVNISAPTGIIIAVPNEDSDILANASEGTGGNIDITALSIIGLEVRDLDPQNARGNGTNDIVASSETGTSGEIIINNLEIDPAEGTVELPAQTVTLGQVAQRCPADSEGNNAFIVTGQGGATPSPRDVIRNQNLAFSGAENQSEDEAVMPIVEADGWHRDQNGTVVFVAQAPLAMNTHDAAYHSCINQGVAQNAS